MHRNSPWYEPYGSYLVGDEYSLQGEPF